jgi:hypothetical protein
VILSGDLDKRPAQNVFDPWFEQDTCALLNTFNANQSQVVIEITERHPLHVTPQLSHGLAALRRGNISVALDDFGTGHSNLSWIAALNPEFIKIDKTFVNQIATGGDTRLIDSMIALAKNMHLKIIAEGVEPCRVYRCLASAGARRGRSHHAVPCKRAFIFQHCIQNAIRRSRYFQYHFVSFDFYQHFITLNAVARFFVPGGDGRICYGFRQVGNKNIYATHYLSFN